MADYYSDIFRDPAVASPDLIDSARKGGRVRAATAQFAVVAATHAINDRAFIVSLPSRAIILPESTIYFDALGAGAADVDFGDAKDPDGLADGEDMTSAGSGSAIQSQGIENYGKRLWEMLGYASDPRSDLDLFLTFKAEPAASGDICIDLRYVID